MMRCLVTVVSLSIPLVSAHLCPPHQGPTFAWLDYVVLGAMLVISCGIGLFYALHGTRAFTSDDFLLGGSQMGTIPMAMSLAAGFITAIELLGNPSEIYIYGTQFWMTCVAFVVVVPITSFLYLPVYMRLKLTSCYEYLEMRFNKSTRMMAACLYILQMVLYTSVAVYAPALALSHVTGIKTYLAVTLVYVVCIFYASQGGMKAVIMTDTFQAVVLLVSILIILVLGQHYVGGFDRLFHLNLNSTRIELPELTPDPTVRHSIWSVVIGGTVYWTTMFCSNQATIQKYLSVESISQARQALWLSSIMLIVVFSINFYTGMVMYAEYSDCDPFSNQVISASDQLLPLFVMNTLGHHKGVPGLFVAGIFAASLGTVAAAMNSLAAVALEDILPVCGYKPKGAAASRWLSAGFGVLSFLLVFVVEQMGSLLQLVLSFNGMAGGVMLGLFSLGMFFPWATSRGALVGSSVALGLVTWIGVGTQLMQSNGYHSAVPKFTSLSGCNCSMTSSPASTILPKDELFVLYRISYLWYSVIGCLVTVVVGLSYSLLYDLQDKGRTFFSPDLMSPPIFFLLERLKIIGLSSDEMMQYTENISTTKHQYVQGQTSEVKGLVNPSLLVDKEQA